MFKKILCGCSLAIALAVSVPATALPVTGEVIMLGAFDTDTGDLATATSIAFVGSGWTNGGTGSYAPINSVSRPVTFMNFTFSPIAQPEPAQPAVEFQLRGRHLQLRDGQRGRWVPPEFVAADTARPRNALRNRF